MPLGMTNVPLAANTVVNLNTTYNLEAGEIYTLLNVGGQLIFFAEVPTTDPDPTIRHPDREELHATVRTPPFRIREDTQYFAWCLRKAGRAVLTRWES